jgi:hypothetical protein
MASAPALAPIKAFEGLFLAMDYGCNGHEMSPDSTVLQFWLKMS